MSRPHLALMAALTILMPLTLACVPLAQVERPPGESDFDLISDTTFPDAAVGLPSPGGEMPLNLVEQSELLQPVAYEQLPNAVSEQVKQTFANDLDVPMSEVGIERYSRETWSDGCLGLGGPAESCLAALTDGWQLEAVHFETQTRAYFRTDFTGDQIRRSEQAQNLPPSLQARLLTLTSEQFDTDTDALVVTESASALWDGCMGVASPDALCSQIAIFGWRTTISDGQQQWTYHTDSVGNDIRLAGN